MKVTAKNIVDNWLDIKPLLPEELAKIGEDSFLPFADMYDEFDEEMIQNFDLFLEKVNKFTDKEDKPKANHIIIAKPKQFEESKPKKTVKESTAKSESASKEKKAKKAGKTKVGESPKWLKTLQSFVKSFAGKTKETWRVRSFVENIQAYFSKKHGNATPNIELIRDIQDKLIKYANSDERKVDIPEYADLVAKCKKAIKEKGFTVSNKAKKPEIKTEELSGFRIGFSK